MPRLLYDLIFEQAERRPQATAIVHRQQVLSYAELAKQVQAVARGLLALGLSRLERVAVYLPKRPETVSTLFGASLAGGVFVPINPLLKPEQVAHILKDCNVRVLVTAPERAKLLAPVLAGCHDLHFLVLVDTTEPPAVHHLETLSWQALLTGNSKSPGHRNIDMDMTAILYTSGSTGKPKGVVLSHRNMLTGALSVAEYLGNHSEDRLLAVLPLSFDAGLSQLTTAFAAGARAVLMDYLLPRDVINIVTREGITGLTAVPPLWVQLAQLSWPLEAQESLRYIANTGGHMPRTTLAALRQGLPKTQVFLMYGLTEAFRSTYLPPAELDRRPDSMGKTIPNAEILVVREDGSPCAPGEPGELVHRGSLVALGYWNDPDKTAQRFRPAPGQPPGLPIPEMAAWSGDTVRMDEDGFLYFIGRKDDMIKTSGYRVSPTEVEEVIYGSGLVAEAAAIGVPHPLLGQGIVVVVKPLQPDDFTAEAVIQHCQRQLPNFMVPLQVVSRDSLPRNPNGKIDRKGLVDELQRLFQEAS
ncbi:MAG TPA: acyl-CoA ligase (AMP-forming), exosortase A system-associated [Candidatus Competibacteraceae bacterium]|nr:acyl-CoA ligase (AMP-forming), exosortase A system-associated [Candidatus Competibacteraceae bacterium]